MKYLIIILILLSSCESKRAANKIAWLKEKGYLNEETKTDSFYIIDTLIGFDTTIVRQFDTLNHVDTLYTEVNGFKTRTIVKWKDRIVEQNHSKDTTFNKILHTRKTIRTTITTTIKPKWWDRLYIGWISCLVFMFVVLYFLNRKNYVK